MKKHNLIDHFESLEVSPDMYDSIQGTNDLDLIDNVTKKRKAKIAKKIAAGKFKGKKLAKKAGIVAGTRMTTFGKIAGVATGGASLVASKAGRKTAKKIGKIVVGSTVLLPLQPLKPMMVKALKKQGVSASLKTPLIDVANLFYKNVVRKNNSSFEDIDLNNLDLQDDHVIGAAIGAVVSGIIAFVKGIKKKKASGEKLNLGEELIETETAVIEAQIASKEGEPVTDENGELGSISNPVNTIAEKIGMSPTMIYIVIGVLVVGIIVFIAMRRKK
jgi:hypothetical protein